jgi:hypothetical protein
MNLLLADTGVALFSGALLIVFILLAIVTSVFWLWMLIDCLTSSLPAAEKLIWALVIIFLHFLGALIYFFVARGGKSSG